MGAVRMNYKGRGKILASSWRFIDILGVMVCSSLLLLVLFFLGTFIDAEKKAFMFFRYTGSLVILVLPILWVRIKYRIKSEVLGLRKGQYSTKKLVFMGCSAALLLTLIFQTASYLRNQPSHMAQTSVNLLHIILYPISIGGLATVVLTPIAEEVMYRGFLYGYLRTKMTITLGLLLQAGLFSVIHLIYIYADPFQLILFFFAAIIFGLLYELTGSLYSSIICHGTLNYLLAVLSVLSE